MMLRIHHQFYVWFLVASLLTACGGGGGGGGESSNAGGSASSSTSSSSALATPVAAGQITQQVIGSAGGTLSLSTTEGAVFSLQIPAGALTSDTSVSIETATATPAQRFHLRFQPGGVVFADGKQATLTISLPAALAVPEGTALGYDGVPVPYTRPSPATLQALLSRFANTATGTNSLVGKLSQWVGPLLTPAASGGPCGGVPQANSFMSGGFTASELSGIAAYGQCVVNAVNALATTHEYVEAVSLSVATAAYLQQVNSGAASSFLVQAGTIACTAYRSKLDAAKSTTVNSMESLYPLVRPILFWEHVIQQLGASCSNIGATEYLTVVKSKIDEALTFYKNEKPLLINVNATNYILAVIEAKTSQSMITQVKSLQPPLAVNQLLDTEIALKAQPALLEAMLEAPWQQCRNTGDFARLIELMESMNRPAAVKLAAQYCGTLLQAQARNAAGSVTATLAPSLGGVGAGNQRTSGSIDVAKDGTLVLDGPIRALQCPAGSAGGSESLQIKLGSTVLQTITAAPYLATSLVIDIAQALRTAGLNASTFNGGTLTINRTGSPCAGFWGENPAPLLTLNLTSGVCVPAAGQAFCTTLLAELAGTPQGLGYPYAISQEGAHVLVLGYTGHVWHQGRRRTLPADFAPHDSVISRAAVANDGSVPGLIVSDPGTGGSSTFMPAVFMPGTGAAVSLLARPVETRGTVTDTVYGQRTLERSLAAMTISPAGRVTFSIWEHALAVQDDLGYCKVIYTDGRRDCSRHTIYESTGPAHGTARTLRTDGLAGATESYLTIVDADAQGRFGASTFLTSQPNAKQPAKNFAVDQGASTYGPYVAAYDGRGVYIDVAASPPTLVLPAGAQVPPGWEVYSVGSTGKALTCNSGKTRFRVIDLGSGDGSAEQSVDIAFTQAGREITARVHCALLQGQRVLDGRGRLIVNGWVESLSVEVPLILTPAGVALP